jgi:hypothetical protein
MKKMRAFAFLSFALTLAACGKAPAPGAAQSAANNEACALVAAPESVFGAGVTTEGDRGLDDMAGYCRLQSADGARYGEIILYTAASLGAVKPADRMAETAAKWDAMTQTPLAPVEGLGDAAQIAADLPGYQAQIVFAKGDKLVLVSARSGDAKMAGEALARALAKAAAS